VAAANAVGFLSEEKSMKKWLKVSALGAAVAAVSVAAWAADLANLSGQSCGADDGVWHFVNNQTGGAAAGSLTATFTSGTCTTGPSKVLGNTQHFICGASGALTGASTNLPGRLVLSDFTCTKKCEKDCEPPK
jgi:hypothetical protein